MNQDEDFKKELLEDWRDQAHQKEYEREAAEDAAIERFLSGIFPSRMESTDTV